jgi:hypothetical protein
MMIKLDALNVFFDAKTYEGCFSLAGVRYYYGNAPAALPSAYLTIFAQCCPPSTPHAVVVLRESIND